MRGRAESTSRDRSHEQANGDRGAPGRGAGAYPRSTARRRPGGVRPGWRGKNTTMRVASREIENPAYLPIIFELPAGAKWDDETTWRLVNPGLHLGFPDLEELRQAARQAKEKPSDPDDFRQFNLCMWLDRSASPFVEMRDGSGESVSRASDQLSLRDTHFTVRLALIS
jgi:phage terminase large subunit-like protein